MDKRPIVPISRLCVTSNVTGRGKRQRSGTERWTVYGVDADGVESVYAEHATEEEHKAWRETDPLWREAQRALFDRLLRDPATRGLVLRINIKAALDAGNTETAVALARHLSPEAWQKLTRKADEPAETDDGPSRLRRLYRRAHRVAPDPASSSSSNLRRRQV